MTSGCTLTPKEKIRYVKIPCPHIKVWDINKTIPSYKMKFKTVKEKETWKRKNRDFLEFVTKLKQYAWYEWGYLRLYEEQLKEYDKDFTNGNR